MNSLMVTCHNVCHDGNRNGDYVTKQMTYKELSAHLNIKLPSARRLVMRKKWHKIKGNDGETRISIPLDFLSGRDDSHDDSHSDVNISNGYEIEALKLKIDGLEKLVESEGKRADAAEKDRDRWHQLANKSWFQRLFK